MCDFYGCIFCGNNIILVELYIMKRITIIGVKIEG